MSHIAKRKVRTQLLGSRKQVTVVEDWHRIEAEQAALELSEQAYAELLDCGERDIVEGTEEGPTGELRTEYRVPAPLGGVALSEAPAFDKADDLDDLDAMDECYDDRTI
jgi:hypothetical protein